jgi:hypothetical protein
MQLGKSFSMTPKAKDLVTHGLYSRLQNPMYLFLDFAICGLALAVHHWSVLLVLVILVPLQIRNARKERALLHEKFGERFEIYRSRHVVLEMRVGKRRSRQDAMRPEKDNRSFMPQINRPAAPVLIHPRD